MKHERLPPQNIEAERSVLGSVLLNSSVMVDVVDVLGSSSAAFYVEAHQLIYEAMLKIYKRRAPVDSVTIYEQLVKDGALERTGGITYLASLTSAVPTSANVEHYAKIVADASTLRQLISSCSLAMQNAYDGKGQAAEIVSSASLDVSRIAQAAVRQKTATVADGLEVALDRIESLVRKKTTGGLETGFKNIDALMCGLDQSLTVLAGRPGTGKTALALNIAHNIARQGKHVLIFSMEMDNDQLTERLCYAISGLRKRELVGGSVPQEEVLNRFAHVVSDSSLERIHVDDRSRQTMVSLGARAKRFMAKTPVAMVIIDYLQLIDAGKGAGQSRREQFDYVSRELKILAGELRVPILALAQLNRESQDGEPELWNLRDSGAIEQDANNVWLLWRLHDHVIGCKIAKHRNGATGVVCLNFDRDLQLYTDSAEVYDRKTKKLVGPPGGDEPAYDQSEEEDVW